MIVTPTSGSLDAEVKRDEEQYTYVNASVSPTTITYLLRGTVMAKVDITYDSSNRITDRILTVINSSA